MKNPPNILSVEESAALDTVIQLKRIADALEALLAATPTKGTTKPEKLQEAHSTFVWGDMERDT